MSLSLFPQPFSFPYVSFPLFLDVPYKVLKSSHQSVSRTPCLAPAPAFRMLVSQGSVLLLALLSLSTLSQSATARVPTHHSFLRLPELLPALRFIESFLKKISEMWSFS